MKIEQITNMLTFINRFIKILILQVLQVTIIRKLQYWKNYELSKFVQIPDFRTKQFKAHSSALRVAATIRQFQDLVQPSQRQLQRQLPRSTMLIQVPNQLRLSEEAIQSDNPRMRYDEILRLA
ncbi:Hypothetical_protein [Hexamita inflata]|uniref:Hypothetical_protein n=1 Tax=Hexamita inflata TaxID=28002 RepID=A0AA86V3D8_9EUKA|nr:Hypothetical protein HINF_LOCUS66539 [Hexamita inflata]